MPCLYSWFTIRSYSFPPIFMARKSIHTLDISGPAASHAPRGWIASSLSGMTVRSAMAWLGSWPEMPLIYNDKDVVGNDDLRISLSLSLALSLYILYIYICILWSTTWNGRRGTHLSETSVSGWTCAHYICPGCSLFEGQAFHTVNQMWPARRQDVG